METFMFYSVPLFLYQESSLTIYTHTAFFSLLSPSFSIPPLSDNTNIIVHKTCKISIISTPLVLIINLEEVQHVKLALKSSLIAVCLNLLFKLIILAQEPSPYVQPFKRYSSSNTAHFLTGIRICACAWVPLSIREFGRKI